VADRGRGLRAGRRRAALRLRGRGLMRAIFIAYVAAIVAGLVYFTALGLMAL
jgi:hypothetical protein